jgi:hypothetical protein
MKNAETETIQAAAPAYNRVALLEKAASRHFGWNTPNR